LVSRVIWKSQEFASEPHFFASFMPLHALVECYGTLIHAEKRGFFSS
jgi:hypothetical protein